MPDSAEVAAHPGHEDLLTAALRAPSAHNAQPWRLVPLDDGCSYELRYAFADRLAADPDDRDGMLAVGAFYETLALSAQREGRHCAFTPAVRAGDHDLVLGTVSLGQRQDDEPADPLAAVVADRRTNRHPYRASPLPDGLQDDLSALGATLVDPAAVAPLVSRASVMAWRDTRFVSDLAEWTRFRDDAPDGLTCACLNLSGLDRMALRFALWRGRLPGWLAWVYAQRDVRLTRASAQVAVLSVPDRDPLTLFDCGRRLLRCWATIAGAGHAYHPISIVIDQATAPELAALAGVGDAVAIFRVGFTPESALTSNRRALSATLVPRHP